MSAKSANIALDNIMRTLKRTNMPRLPPAPGFDGDEEFKTQVSMWKKWVAWEKEDPLVLKDDEPQAFKQRVLYCYKQALMALRFWPEMWVDAATWCLENNVRDSDGKPVGTELLLQGISANPESVLLALKHADHIEKNYPEKEGNKSEYAKAVRQPYDTVLDTLYKLGDKVKEREKLEVNTLKQAAAREPPVQESIEPDDDDDDNEEEKKPKLSPMEQRILAIQRAYATESQLLSRTISYVWIAMARAMRRIQGKGNQNEGGLRKVFTDARQKGRLTSDVYVAVAMLESVVYKDPVGAKIFERGSRLFPNDEGFMIEYIKYLHARDDTTSTFLKPPVDRRERRVLTECRRARCVRDVRKSPSGEARDAIQGETSVCLFPQVRISVWRTVPDLKARGQDGRAVSRGSQVEPLHRAVFLGQI